MSTAATSTGRPVRVLLADDHRIFAEALATTLGADDRVDVVGFAHDGNEAVALAESLAPDVVFMDLAMPGIDGIEATRRIRDRDPGTCVLMLTSSDSPMDARRAREAGVAAFLTKDKGLTEVMDVFFELSSLMLAFGSARPARTND